MASRKETLNKELIYLVLQHLNDEKYKETIHKLEQESGVFFNMKYFEDLVLEGKWEEAEKYLSSFTKIDDNRFSVKIFFEIRKQKYLEALDRNDRAKAVDILVKDLKVFAPSNDELFKEITHLITLENFRQNEQLSNYMDTRTARSILMIELKKLIEANPVFTDKLQFPSIKGRLQNLLEQSFNFQHSLCPNPMQSPEPDIRTLNVDHKCRRSSNALLPASTSNLAMGSTPRPEGFLPMNANGPFRPASTACQSSFIPWTLSPHPAAAGGTLSLGPLTTPAAMLKNPGDYDDMSKARSTGNPDRIILPASSSGQGHNLTLNMIDDLPKTIVRALNQASTPMSMDFHPTQHTVLLVGTNDGDTELWEVSSREKLFSVSFKIWDNEAISMTLKAALTKDPCISVNRVLWSPDGFLVGIAYSKHMVQLYTFQGRNEIRQHLEIESHVGGVNDIAFASLRMQLQLSVITCGDDRTVKVWDVSNGTKLCTFEGHEAPVYSVCPHSKDNIQFLFSTSKDGRIKAWLYDMVASRIDFVAPGHSCTTLAYSADGKRLFSCGSTESGETHLVEWNEGEGVVRRTYQGFCGRSSGVVQFDMAKNRVLAAGDDHLIKFWDMDNANLLSSTSVEGSLPASPRIRFNKEGTLLAVSANDNKIIILSNFDGLRLLCPVDSRFLIPSRIASETEAKHGVSPHSVSYVANAITAGMDTRNSENVMPRLTEESNTVKLWKLTEIGEPAQCRSLRLPIRVKSDKILRLTYTNAGTGLLALTSNALHLLWKWPKNALNLSGKVTTKDLPKLWQPPSGIIMTNDLTESKAKETLPCFALSKNDSYLMSVSGGKISLFNVMTFKTMTTFMSPPPVATCLAFHPLDNNVIAIGMDDSTIRIYNVRTDMVVSKLDGHSKRITGLAFSNVLNLMASSGADSQIIVWNADRWEKEKSTYLQISSGVTPLSDTQVEFHQDQIHFLAVHETQLAIYEITKLECIKQWVVADSAALISHAAFSCDSQLVFAGFLDGKLCVFSASNLMPQCQINPTAYLPSDARPMVYPLVIAAHPHERNQFAAGLTDGGVLVFEPEETEGKWGVPPPADHYGSSSSAPTAPPAVAPTSDQPKG